MQDHKHIQNLDHTYLQGAVMNACKFEDPRVGQIISAKSRWIDSAGDPT